jgi:hypothetical protein
MSIRISILLSEQRYFSSGFHTFFPFSFFGYREGGAQPKTEKGKESKAKSDLAPLSYCLEECKHAALLGSL